MFRWFEKYPDLFLENQKLVNENYQDLKLFWEADKSNVYWKGPFVHYGQNYNVEVKFLHGFPYSQPRVFLFNDKNDLIDFRQTTHQLTDGSICLFTWDGGKDAWDTNYTIIDLINKLKFFLSEFVKGSVSKLHSSYNIPISRRLIGTAYFLEKYKKFPKNAFGFGTFIHMTPYPILIVKHMEGVFNYKKFNRHFKRFPKEKRKEISQIKFIYSIKDSLLSQEDPLLPFSWISCDDRDFENLLQVTSWGEITNYLSKYLAEYRPQLNNILMIIRQSSIPNNPEGVIYCNRLLDIFNLRIGFIPIRWESPYNILKKRSHTLIGDVPNDIFKKKIILIGLGSLGSEIGMQLAKNHMANFILVDKEPVQIENISRQSYFISQINMMKSTALEGLIRGKVLKPDILLFENDFMSQYTLPQIFQHLGPDSLAIITIADHEVEMEINQVMLNTKTPCIYATVNSKAEMGRIFRVIPNESPCYECITLIAPNCDDQNTLLYSFPCDREENIPYEEGLPGLSFDTMEIANFTARFAFQTIIDLENLEIDYPHKMQNHYFYIIHESEGYTKGIHVQKYKRLTNCKSCGTKLDKEEDLAAVKKILGEI